ncbi:ABC transporter permease [Magnetovibrio sp.]|uniref:ABC transporter permease n=1 Tax=Magnetovibrio sp. TaxID=2024836 RepID=UPI002F94239A
MSFQTYLDMLPLLGQGALLTIQLLLLSAVAGLILAVPLALARVSRSWWINLFPRTYIFFFRGTPLLVQLFLVYYGLGQFEAVRESFAWPVLRDAYWCAVITFSLHTAAYISEILRGAIQAVPVGEIEAARAIGMRPRQVYARIILPRAFRMALPAYGNEIILMLKASALASTITLLDLTGMAKTISAKNYMPVETFITAGAFYLVITYVLTHVIRYLEKHLHPDRKEPVVIVG